MGKEADLSWAVAMPARPLPDTGAHQGALSPLCPRRWEGTWGQAPSLAPLLQQHLPHGQHHKPWGRGRERDLGGWGGKGESFVDQSHILLGNPHLGEPHVGAEAQQEVCARGDMESMGDWQSATSCFDLAGLACSTLGMLEARLTLSKVTMDSGHFGCLSVGVHKLLKT